MPHSLRARLGGLRHKQIISSKDYDRLCKALDNENVLDKIRAEIQAMSTDYCGGYIGLDKREVLKIIDKYTKGESE
jgi:hypothetical protein